VDEVTIRLVGLPAGVNGLAVKDENGDYNIYINACISSEEQRRALRHELAHVSGGHFDSSEHAAELERAVTGQAFELS